MIFLLISVFESVKIRGEYKFPDESQLDLYNNSFWDQVSDYIRLPQKLLSKDQCKYLQNTERPQNVWFNVRSITLIHT